MPGDVRGIANAKKITEELGGSSSIWRGKGNAYNCIPTNAA